METPGPLRASTPVHLRSQQRKAIHVFARFSIEKPVLEDHKSSVWGLSWALGSVEVIQNQCFYISTMSPTGRYLRTKGLSSVCGFPEQGVWLPKGKDFFMVCDLKCVVDCGNHTAVHRHHQQLVCFKGTKCTTWELEFSNFLLKEGICLPLSWKHQGQICRTCKC